MSFWSRFLGGKEDKIEKKEEIPIETPVQEQEKEQKQIKQDEKENKGICGKCNMPIYKDEHYKRMEGKIYHKKCFKEMVKMARNFY